MQIGQPGLLNSFSEGKSLQIEANLLKGGDDMNTAIPIANPARSTADAARSNEFANMSGSEQGQSFSKTMDAAMAKKPDEKSQGFRKKDSTSFDQDVLEDKEQVNNHLALPLVMPFTPFLSVVPQVTQMVRNSNQTVFSDTAMKSDNTGIQVQPFSLKKANWTVDKLGGAESQDGELSEMLSPAPIDNLSIASQPNNFMIDSRSNRTNVASKSAESTASNDGPMLSVLAGEEGAIPNHLKSNNGKTSQNTPDSMEQKNTVLSKTDPLSFSDDPTNMMLESDVPSTKQRKFNSANSMNLVADSEKTEKVAERNLADSTILMESKFKMEKKDSPEAGFVMEDNTANNEPHMTVKDSASKQPENVFADILQQRTAISGHKTEVVHNRPATSQFVQDTHNITAQIVEQAHLVKDSQETQMIIKLKPEHLGELTLKVSVNAGVVNASFHSDNVEVRNVIEASLTQLKQEMSNQGLKVDNVGVYAGLGQFLSNGQREAPQQPIVKFKNKRAGEEAFDESEQVIIQSQTTSDTGVDYRI